MQIVPTQFSDFFFFYYYSVFSGEKQTWRMAIQYALIYVKFGQISKNNTYK